jgi:7,8-dihydropterin-6-yl-methyl-4-(beta-D-ribofuranosyl)aminobenzene 5'-phosphate synthase
MEVRTMLTITVLYDNVAHDARLQTDWGLACLVEGLEQPLLFDTGGKATSSCGICARWDWTRRRCAPSSSPTPTAITPAGAGFLAENPDVTVYLLASFPAGIKDTVRQAGATLVEVTGPQAIDAAAYTTGELGDQIREQALVLETPRVWWSSPAARILASPRWCARRRRRRRAT